MFITAVKHILVVQFYKTKQLFCGVRDAIIQLPCSNFAKIQNLVYKLYYHYYQYNCYATTTTKSLLL